MPKKTPTPLRRKNISQSVQDKVLLSCRRRCALCFYLNGEASAKLQGQIAHIDRNSSNNREDNLAYLCLEHHDLYDSKTSQSKRLGPSELCNAKQELLDFLSIDNKRGPVEVIIRIDQDFKTFDTSALERVLIELRNLVKHGDRMSVTKISQGSVKIDILMDAEDVASLMIKLRRGELKDARISSVVPKSTFRGQQYNFVEPFSDISHFSQRDTIRIFEESDFIADVRSIDPTARLRACCRCPPGIPDVAAITLACITYESIILTPPLIIRKHEVDEWCCDRPLDLLQGFLSRHGVAIGQAGHQDTNLILNRQIHVSSFATSTLSLQGYIEHTILPRNKHANVCLILRLHGRTVFILVAYSISLLEHKKQGRVASSVSWFG